MRAASDSDTPSESIIRTASSTVMTEPANAAARVLGAEVFDADRLAPDLILAVTQARGRYGIANEGNSLGCLTPQNKFQYAPVKVHAVGDQGRRLRHHGSDPSHRSRRAMM